MIYNTRNWGNDTTENQKEKTCFNAYFQYSQSKIMGLCKMSLKSLAQLVKKLSTLRVTSTFG